MTERRLTAYLAVTLSAIVVAACGERWNVVHPGSRGPAPATPAGCMNVISDALPASPPPSLATTFRAFKRGAVFVAAIEAELPARYANADGNRPRGDESLSIVTPLRISLNDRWTGSVPRDVVLPSGKVGCDTVTENFFRGVHPDITAVIATLPPDVPGSPEAARIAFAWQVNGGSVLLPRRPSTVDANLGPIATKVSRGDTVVDGSAVAVNALRALAVAST